VALLALVTLMTLVAPAARAAPPILPDRRADPLPLGTVAPGPSDPRCLPGLDCPGFTVTCPNLNRPAPGYIEVRPAEGEVQGMVVLLSGGPGTDYWEEGDSGVETFLGNLTERGLTVLRVRWRMGWLQATAGERAGPKQTGCRPATLLAWIHDVLYVPLELDPPPQTCGYCVAGQSGGASEVGYALSFYGIDPLVDVAAMSGGPTYADIAPGCLDPFDRKFYDAFHRSLLDGAYGFRRSSGPCFEMSDDWGPRWAADSIEVGGTYVYGETRVAFIEGMGDQTGAPQHGDAYIGALSSTPFVVVYVVRGMAHAIGDSVEGLTILVDELSPGGPGRFRRGPGPDST
jgi:hypothetical protein